MCWLKMERKRILALQPTAAHFSAAYHPVFFDTISICHSRKKDVSFLDAVLYASRTNPRPPSYNFLFSADVNPALFSILDSFREKYLHYRTYCTACSQPVYPVSEKVDVTTPYHRTRIKSSQLSILQLS
jgi:hypothetical protein